MVEVTVLIAFVAGILSFISPCILPIVPGFLGYLAGTVDPEKELKRGVLFLNSLSYVLGFSLVFALLGVLFNGVLTGASYTFQIWLSRIGGAIIILFGLHFVGLLHLRFLDSDHKIGFKKKFKTSYLNSFVFGVIFAVGWTPCVGAVLGSVLALALANPGASFFLLLAYALGLGIPFLLVGLFFDKSRNILHKIGSKLKYYNLVIGIFLIILGILVFTQSLDLLANFSVLNSFFIPS